MQGAEKNADPSAVLSRSVTEAVELTRLVNDANERLGRAMGEIKTHLACSRRLVEAYVPSGPSSALACASVARDLSPNAVFEFVKGQIWTQIGLAESRRKARIERGDPDQVLDYPLPESIDPAGRVDAYEDAVYCGIDACTKDGILPGHFEAAAFIQESYGLLYDEKVEAIQRAFDRLDPELVTFVNDVMEGKSRVSVRPSSSDDAHV
jgi:hypothetical protein